MIFKLILYLSFITFSLCILCYRGMAKNLEYQIGRKINNKFEYVGGIIFIGGVIECFLIFPWWIVIIGIIMSVFLGVQFTTLFKERTQWLAPLLVLLSFIGIIIYQNL